MSPNTKPSCSLKTNLGNLAHNTIWVAAINYYRLTNQWGIIGWRMKMEQRNGPYYCVLEFLILRTGTEGDILVNWVFVNSDGKYVRSNGLKMVQEKSIWEGWEILLNKRLNTWIQATPTRLENRRYIRRSV